MSIETEVQVVESHDDFRVIRRVPAMKVVAHDPHMVGCVVDVETTGLDDPKMIEIAVVLFGYDADGNFTGMLDSYSSLQDPGCLIPAEATSINGITDAMVAGQSIDTERVAAMIQRANILIAHNAYFDRPVMESHEWMPTKPWGCSYKDIDWFAHDVRTRRLEYILYRHGLFFDGHRALDDCEALLHVLVNENDGNYLRELLASARVPGYVVFVHEAFDIKDLLKERGYKWQNAEQAVPKSWKQQFDQKDDLDTELQYLFDLDPKLELDVGTITARTRWSETPYVLSERTV